MNEKKPSKQRLHLITLKCSGQWMQTCCSDVTKQTHSCVGNTVAVMSSHRRSFNHTLSTHCKVATMLPILQWLKCFSMVRC